MCFQKDKDKQPALCARGLNWSLVLLLPPFDDPPAVHADVAAEDYLKSDKEAMRWYSAMLIILRFIECCSIRSVFFIDHPGNNMNVHSTSQNALHSSRASAKILLRALTSSPKILVSIDKMITFRLLQVAIT